MKMKVAQLLWAQQFQTDSNKHDSCENVKRSVVLSCL